MLEIAPGQHIGPYVVERSLPAGKGGMARVCICSRGTESGGLQRVALKIAEIPDARSTGESTRQTLFSDALINEVEVLKQLRHPSIVQIYPIPYVARQLTYSARATELPGQPWYFVMEYLEGGSVLGHIQEQGKLQVREAIEITHQISQALDYIHAKGMVHLDIKTSNILFRHIPAEDKPPETVLIDFGVARRRNQPTIDAASLLFVAPERLRAMLGETPPETETHDRRPADVYSLGVALYHMLTGRLPFSGREKASVTSAILTDTPSRPTQYNPQLESYPKIEDLVLWMLEKDPKARPTAEQVASHLVDMAFAPPRYDSSSTPGAGTTRQRPRQGQIRLLQVALGLLLAASVVEAAMLINVNNKLQLANQALLTSTAIIPVSATPTATPTVAPATESVYSPTLLPTVTLIPTYTPTRKP